MDTKNPALAKYMHNFEELRIIFDNLPEGIVVLLDADMNMMAANKTVSDLLGLDVNQFVGQRSEEILNQELAGIPELVKETISYQRPVKNFNFEWTSRTGVTKSFLINTVLISFPGSSKPAVAVIMNDVSEITRLRQKTSGSDYYGELVGNSDKMQEVYAVIDTIKDYDSAVLIAGETGTGKELAARAIHSAGERRNQPFIPVQCSALPENLLESELFGHVRGAYTGATQDKKGRFIAANGGTLFLDEIGTLSENAQIKLLRVLQEKVIEPIGSNRQIPVNVRILSATNRNLAELVERGQFRSDLFYRLKVIQVDLPPLRDRKSDIVLLTDHFISRLNRYYSKHILGVSQEAMKKLMNYYWPGNVRELENAIEHAFVLTRGGLLELRHFPPEMRLFDSNHTSLKPALKRPGQEEENIRRALLSSHGNMNEAARILNMHRTTLWRKMREYAIEKGYGKFRE